MYYNNCGNNPATCPLGTTAYTVKAGDTFYSIAIKHNTTVAAIIAANPNVNPNTLYIGQVICVPMTQPPHPPQPCPGGNHYTVQAGDTFYSIAVKFNVSLDALLKANPNLNPDNLMVGQVICIPGSTPPPPSGCPAGTTPYIVRQGDTFFSIARQHNVSLDELMKANPNVNPDNLRVGQVICIPGSTPPPTSCPVGTTPYIVKAGDTFFSIARQHNVSVDALMKANPNVNPDNLRIGQVICIPGSTPPPTSCPVGTTPYIVKAGDTFFTIARQHNVSVDALMKANPNVDPDNLRIGQVICIPGSTPPPGCPTGTTPYTIKSGDTLYLIAQKNNTTVEAIMAVNPGINPNNLQIGQVICIPGSTPPPSGCPTGTTPYTIKAGDTFYTLAKKYNTTVEAIEKANPGVNPNNLQVGQVICMPGSTPPPSGCPKGTTPYTIKAGDTFYTLAKKYNTTVEAIEKANPGVNPNNLQVGQVICMPTA